MDDITDIKAKNPIEDVIEETGYPLQHRSGRYRRGSRADCDSLVVDTHHQAYHWNSMSEHGDVINWLINRNKTDFRGAVEWLCNRAKLPVPRWTAGDQNERMASRAKEDAWDVAVRVMNKWLSEDAAALGYVHGRGWSDETIQAAHLGFTGREVAAKAMSGELSMHNVDLESVAAVAIIGYRGNVRAWAKAHNLADHPNWSRDWEEWGFVPGLMGKTRLVYPHLYMGRVRYISGRNILGAEINKEGREVKSYNLPVCLGGLRQVYYNHVYTQRADECVIVEGQADAITLGQWGIPAAAICGTAFSDHTQTIMELRKRHNRIYLALDADEAGQAALVGRGRDWPLADLFGPMARVIRWPVEKWQDADGKERVTKDANDWLQMLQGAAHG